MRDAVIGERCPDGCKIKTVRQVNRGAGVNRGEEAVLQVDDDALVALALGDLADAVGLSVKPVDQHVQRWGGGLPQYAVGHLDRVRNIRTAVASVPGLAVCGAAYDGLGIPACVASAELAATQVLDALDEQGEWTHD